MEICCGGKFTTEPDNRRGYRVICAKGFEGGCGGLSLEEIEEMALAAGIEHGARPRKGILFLDTLFRPITSRTSRAPRNAESTRRVE